MNVQLKEVAWLKAAVVGACLAAGAVSCGGDHHDHGSNGPPMSGSRFAATSLVSDSALYSHVDPNLVNGWGIAFNPTGFAWVANNGTSTSTLYDGNGVPQSLVVSIPAGGAGDASPTGIVFNGTQDFKVTQNGATGTAAFIFVGEAGTVAGWSPTVNRTAAVTMVDASAGGAVYKGLALAANAGGNFLYAANFGNNAVDVYDANFRQVSLPGNFQDPALPAGYGPFGIQAVGDRIYVAFAQHAASGKDEVHGAGLGIVDVFDTSGALLRRLVTGGALNAPWGMAMAPANFGSFSNTLLVGNFGDGKINAYDPATGAPVGTLSKADGSAIAIDGLWGIAFGNGINNQPTNTLFFAAGPGDEAHGLYGRVDMQ